MAKTASITVNVNDQQFNAFIKNFNDFSSKLKGLNNSFQQINQTIQNTQKQSNALLNTMRSLYSVTSSLLKPVASITSHFLKWGTIIGGITALLGMGGGLFGIERLANSILQKRRQVMGLGGNYGGTQASLIYGQSILSNPAAVLQNIALGQAGDMDKMGPLIAMGIPFGTKDTPEETLNKILKRLPDILKNVEPNLRMPLLQGYGLDKIFTDPMDLLRLTTEAGRKEIEQKIKLEEAHRKEFDLSEKAQKAWADFDIQLRAAGARMQTILGEGLQKLAKPLSDLSDSFVNLIKVLMDTGIVRKIIDQLTEWINKLSEYLKSDNLQKDLKRFSDEVESWLPWLKELAGNLKQFGDILGNIVGVLQKIWGIVRWFDWKEKQMQQLGDKLRGEADTGGSALTPESGAGYDSMLGGGTSRSTTTTNNNQRSSGGTTINPPASTGPASSAPQSRPPDYMPHTSPIFKHTSFMGGPSFASGSANVRSPIMAFNDSQPGAMTIGGMRNSAASNSSFNQRFAAATSTGGFSGGTSVNSASMTNRFSAAAASRVPTDRGGGLAFAMNNVNNTANIQGRQRGPLSADNWQMNRTAKLEIRNVPGSNVFMSGTGMSVA